MNKQIKFKGYPSGDYETFCWNVSKEDFIRLTEKEPDEESDKSCFHHETYRIYPFMLYNENYNEQEIYEWNIKSFSNKLITTWKQIKK